MAKITHKALFEKLRDDTVVQRCVQYAHWTLPQLMANFADSRGNSRLIVERDYQEIGALLVNNLASKLVRLLFPVSAPFFKVEASPAMLAEAKASGREVELTSHLAQIEMNASQRLFLNGSYAQLILALKHLIITGNVLLYRDAQNAESRTYGLQSFGIRRDGRGKMLDCVLREFTYVEALPWEIQTALRSKDRTKYSREEAQVELYTRIHRETRGPGVVVYVVTQQVDTLDIGEPSVYPEHLCPWHAPAWSLILGEHYGRGHVEDYAGGFATMSDLSESAALYGIEMMRVLHLVTAGSGTDIDDLANSETGEFVRGSKESVTAYEAGDAAKAQFIEAKLANTMARLQRAFMYKGNTRDAERVTMFELQLEAQEAEGMLGGVFSSLSSGIQQPLAGVLIVEQDPNALAGLIDGSLKLNVTAGIPALGRSSEVQSLAAAAQEVVTIVPPLVQTDNRFSAPRLVDMIMAGRSVNTSALFLSKQEMVALQKAQQQQQLGEQQILAAQAGADASQQLQSLQQG